MIKALNRIFRQDKERMNIPKSVQQVIPVKRIWPDGIWLVGNKYSKCWRFSDINYAIASKDDKTAMFLDYSELLNALDSSATTKITICNKQMNKQAFEESILLPLRSDQFDVYRKEYNDMLMDKVTDVSNSIVQERYITVSIVVKDIDEARSYFNRVGADLSSHLAQLSSTCVELDSVERLCIFHDFFRAGEEAYYHMDLKASMRCGHSFRDYICPDVFSFEKDHFIMGNKFGRVLFLKDYASYIKDSFISDLCELNRNLFLSTDIIPVPTDEAVREVESKLLGVETNITQWQRKQNQNNNFSAVVPYDLEQQRREAKEFLDDLTSRDQRMMFALVSIVHVADSKEQLDRDTETLLAVGRKHLCQLAVLKYQQMDGLNTALPYGLRKINAMRTLTTESTAVLMPFRAHEIMDIGGIYCGVNAISRNLIIADRKQLINGNGFILGVSGSGKSFFAKREIIFLLLGTSDDIIIGDPQNEYTSLVNALGGAVVNLSPTSSNHINALDLSLGYGDRHNPIVAKTEFVLSFFEALLEKDSQKLSAGDKSIIDRCLGILYEDYLKSNYTIQPPTLVDLHHLLKQQTDSGAERLALTLESNATGSLNMFAHQTNVDVHNRLVAYGIRDLGSQQRTPGMLVMTDAIRNRVAKNRERGIRTHIFLDEMHIFFANDFSASFFSDSWKQFRKDGALATGITQNVEDCLKSLTARTMLANSEYLVMLNQAPTDRAKLAELLHISDNQLSYITNVGFGKGLLKCGNSIVPFIDNSSKQTKLYALMSTHPGEIQEILG
jgi:hypothetical protein